MRSKMLNADLPITYAMVLDMGDEIIGGLGKFVPEQEDEGASVTPIGAFSSAVLGILVGNQAVQENLRRRASRGLVVARRCRGQRSGTDLYLHAVLGKADGSVVGGHLIEAMSDPPWK
jgi:predicted DNA-binding protein with PD1-like motif